MTFNFLLFVTLLSFSAFAKVVKIQEPIFHVTEISAKSLDCKCKFLFDSRVKENAKALFLKMKDKGVFRVWVSGKELVIRKGKHLYLKRKYNKELKEPLPYICGSNTFKVDLKSKGKNRKEHTKRERRNKKSIIDHSETRNSTSSSTDEKANVPIIVYKQNVTLRKWDQMIELLYGKNKSHKGNRIHRVLLNQEKYQKLFN
jgi:hypothetical protein